MLTVQQMLDIACRHVTAMSDAMVAACVQWACDNGEPLRLPARSARAPARGERPADATDWERMVRGNSDTRWQHC